MGPANGIFVRHLILETASRAQIDLLAAQTGCSWTLRACLTFKTFTLTKMSLTSLTFSIDYKNKFVTSVSPGHKKIEKASARLSLALLAAFSA
jgi:hypothetical protein